MKPCTRTFCIFILSTVFCLNAYAQEDEVISGVDESSLKSALVDLETRKGIRIYFLDAWLEGHTAPVLADTLDLSKSLAKLLEGTAINFYEMNGGQQVVLLKNDIIYDRLPAGFFQTRDSTQGKTEAESGFVPQPVFAAGFYNRDQAELPPLRIGNAAEAAGVNAFSLSGSVLNAQNNEPLADIPIRDENGTVLALSDANGQYRLTLPRGHSRIRISGVGIQTLTRDIIVYGNGSVDFLMNEDIQQLDEVVVEADRRSNVEDAVTGSETIDSEGSKNIPVILGERDILQVARNLPGISSTGEGASGLHVRGGKTDQNLILLDEAVVYNPTHFFGIFQALNPFTTRGVTIYKGSVPAEFGGRLSSVFDIKSINGNMEEIAGEGSIGPVTANLALEVPIKKDTASLVLGARGAYADWILKSLDDESLNNSEASFFDFLLNYNHRISTDEQVKGTAYFSYDDFSITSDSLYRYTNAMVNARWEKRLGEKSAMALSLGNSDYRFGIRYDGDANTDFNLDYGINQTQLKLKFSRELNAKHRINYGLNAQYYSVNPGAKEPRGGNSVVAPIQIEREQAAELTAFVGDLYEINEKWLLDYSARLTVYSALGKAAPRKYTEGQPRTEANVVGTEEFGSGEPTKLYLGPEFRISGRYLIDEQLSVKLGLNSAYQFLHTLSNNTTVSPIDTWKLSDTHLKPQRGYQMTLGLFKDLVEGQWQISLEGYYKLMRDVLDFKTGANLFLNPNVETEVLQGDGKSYGVEFLLRKSEGRLNGWLGYTYSRSLYRFNSDFAEERINDGDYFPSNFDKPHDLSLVTNYRFTRRYSVSANFVYQTGRPVTFPVGTFRFNNSDLVVYSDRNAFRIPDYYRLDLGVNIEGNHRKNKLAHSFWTISVYNVLGRNNPYSVFFVTENGEVKALQSSIFAIPVPSITYSFKF